MTKRVCVTRKEMSGWHLRIPIAVAVVVALGIFQPATVWAGPYPCEDDFIEVMFEWGTQVRMRENVLVDLAPAKGMPGLDPILIPLGTVEWQRISDVSEEKLDEMRTAAMPKAKEILYDLNNIYRVRIPKGHDIWVVSQQLEALPGVLLARPVPLPMPLPIPGPFMAQQGYCLPASAAPTGIDASYAWTQPGGDGTGVTIYDLEYSWNYNHADLTKAVGSQINTTVTDPLSDNNHGTAVLGELIADNNGWGVTGIAYGANIKTCGTYYGLPSWNVPGALILAISQASAGDVILLEQQWDYNSAGAFIPIEWWLNYSPGMQSFNAVYAAIVQATTLGIHVVEAGGNGSVDTGALTWYGDNGAVVVGAGGAYAGGGYPEGDLQRISFSSYGWRFNLQGWGEDVMTTGYGYYYNAEGANYYYTNSFSGTSSASPIVAGAIACCVGYWNANFGGPQPTPTGLRTLLNIYGTSQVFPPNGAIGQRPDLLRAFAAMTPTCSCPFQADFDANGFIDSVDLSDMIDIVFFGMTDPGDPLCPGLRGDFNADGVTDSIDLSEIIDYVFFGGLGPKDPCNCSPYPTNCP